MTATISLKDQPITDPGAPTVGNQGTPGAVSYGYAIVGVAANGTRTAASATTTTATGAATLNGTNFNRITWVDPTGAQVIEIYRVTSGGTPSSTGKIGQVAAGVQTFDDKGLAGDGATAPATNGTGSARGGQNYMSGAGWTPGRTISQYVNGRFVGVAVAGPYAAAPAAGGYGEAAYGNLSVDLNVPDSSVLAAGTWNLTAQDNTNPAILATASLKVT